ncbi:hypothetical protein DFH29DRAFT_1001359 [Suillus ampliporus]|nr:hypothetical protein DFH29DRAFT_1001359 [Suillus ampliporus]
MVLTDEDNDSLLLLKNHKDLLFYEDNGAYYMSGVSGGLGIDESHLRQLDALIQKDEPDVSLAEDNLERLNHAGLVVWEFSNDEDEAVVDEW